MLARYLSIRKAMQGNNLAREMGTIENRYLRRGAYLTAAGVVVILVLYIAYDFSAEIALFSAFSWLCICLAGQMNEAIHHPKYRKLESGLNGEKRVCAMLSKLDREMVVRNQVLLPNKRSRTGHTEIDFILVGRKALYLVETKNNAGTIFVDEEAREWEIDHAGDDARTMRNPVRQVLVQAKVLKECLGKKGMSDMIIQPTVVFSNKDADLVGEENSSVPLFTFPAKDFTGRVLKFEEALSGSPDIDQTALLTVLDQLHAEALVMAAKKQKKAA